MRVLIVEDNPLVALDIAEEVRGAGAEVVGLATTGQRGLELMRRLAPDLLFLDVDLADRISGCDIAEAISSDEIICVFVTAAPGRVPPDVAAKWPVVPKPVTGAEIRRILERIQALSAEPLQ